MDFNVLLISHNCFSTFQNMGKTLKALFGAFDKKQINQLYFHASYPDVDVCQSLFRITDIEIINSIKCFHRKCGSIVDKHLIRADNALFDNEQSVAFHQAKKKKKYLIALRDILWGFRRWDTRELNTWLDDIDPDTIFFAAGDAIFPYTISLIIAKRRNIPLVVYFCDDYYTFKEKTLSPAYRIHHFLLKKSIKKVVSSARALVYISPSMEEEYRRLFGKTGEVIMTPYQNRLDIQKEPVTPLIMTYAGNLSLNRWRTLRLIGEALSEINKYDIRAVLNIYSGSKEEITDQLTIENAMYFKGNITASEISNVIAESDILVHAESFDKSDIPRVKHSISTKIADYLASNRLILAIGPNEVASIAYLKKNNAAYIIDSKNEMVKDLKILLNNFHGFTTQMENAAVLSNSFHLEGKNSERLKEIFTIVITR